jgi:hypothetical protein
MSAAADDDNALSLEISDLDELESSAEEDDHSASSSEGSVTSDEDGGYFCDRCEKRRETPGVERSSPRPIVGVRYSQRDGDEDLCAACYSTLSREEQRGYDVIRDRDDSASESDEPPRLSPDSKRGVHWSLAEETGDDDDSELEEDDGEVSGFAERDELDSIRQGTTPAASREDGSSSSEQANSDSSDEDDSAASQDDSTDDDASPRRATSRRSLRLKKTISAATARDLMDSFDDVLGSNDLDAIRNSLGNFTRAPPEVQADGASRVTLPSASIVRIHVQC